MRLNLLLPDVKPDQLQLSKQCAKEECKGKRFYPRQVVEKKIVDGKYQKVQAWRYGCARCGCTFRVYPQGVGRQHISHRVIGLAVMLYVLGLSYGAVAIVLGALGIGIGKTSSGRCEKSAGNEAREVVGWLQNRSGWCRCNQRTL
jgi:hypothetical protein